MLSMKDKPKTFIKGVLTSDVIIIDLVSNPAYEEAEAILKLIRNPPDIAKQHKQVVIVVSSALCWANTPRTGDAFCDADSSKRVPPPKY